MWGGVGWGVGGGLFFFCVCVSFFLFFVFVKATNSHVDHFWGTSNLRFASNGRGHARMVGGAIDRVRGGCAAATMRADSVGFSKLQKEHLQ